MYVQIFGMLNGISILLISFLYQESISMVSQGNALSTSQNTNEKSFATLDASDKSKESDTMLVMLTNTTSLDEHHQNEQTFDDIN